ncbi:hypothetical protein ABHN11_27970 [Brevibacillus centrosporus]|uniref:hypothetical protein n=1 Tax=Brevibacillus centrosporus TaxID=54910 RepID=UPI003D1AC0B7
MDRVDLSKSREKKELEKLPLTLGQELAMEKIKGLQKDVMIQSLGEQVALLKIEMMQLKGGGN